MFICVECGHIFEDPRRWVETHGLDSPPYEEWLGCPECAGNYTDAHECDCCGEYINDDYIKTADDLRFCDQCWNHVRLGGEE